MEESVNFFVLEGGGHGGAAVGGHTLQVIVCCSKTFISLKKAPKQTLCSLPTSHMLYIGVVEKYSIS